MSWGQVLPGLDDPIVGDPGSYDGAAGATQDLANSTQSVSTEFKNIVSGKSSDQVQGASADKLRQLISELDGSFNELPGVFTKLNGIFTTHAEKLRTLQKSADQALARATTRWQAVQSAENAHQKSTARLNSIDRQIERLMNQPPGEGVDQQVQQLTAKRSSASNSVANASGSIKSAKSELERSRVEHAGLVKDEQALVEETRGLIAQVDPGELEDPGLLQRWADTVGGWIDSAEEFASDCWKYIGDHFWNFMWRLSDFLGGYAEYLSWVTIAFAALACIPALTEVMAPLAAQMALITFCVKIEKIIIDTALLYSGAPHPDDKGRVMSAKDVGIETVVAVITYFGGNWIGSKASSTGASAIIPALDDVVRGQALVPPIAGLAVSWNGYVVATRGGHLMGELAGSALEDRLPDDISRVIDAVDTPIVRSAIDTSLEFVAEGMYPLPSSIPAPPLLPLGSWSLPAAVVAKVIFDRDSIDKIRRFGLSTDSTTASFQLVGVS